MAAPRDEAEGPNGYEYDFVSIELRDRSFRLDKVPAADYRDVIRDRAAQGWRFVQVFAPGVTLAGEQKRIDLIFERVASRSADSAAGDREP